MAKKYLLWTMFFLLGLLSGWMLRNYWENQASRAESLMLLGEANEALRKGEIDVATDFALRAATRNQESFLAVLMVAELYDKRGANQMAIRYYQNALAILRVEGGVDNRIQQRLEILTKTISDKGTGSN